MNDELKKISAESVKSLVRFFDTLPEEYDSGVKKWRIESMKLILFDLITQDNNVKVIHYTRKSKDGKWEFENKSNHYLYHDIMWIKKNMDVWDVNELRDRRETVQFPDGSYIKCVYYKFTIKDQSTAHPASIMSSTE
jgi:hypothetical protein